MSRLSRTSKVLWAVDFVFFCVLLSLIVISEAEGKDLIVGDIELGVTAHNICASLEKGDTLTLKSRGGNVDEAYRLAECVREKGVTTRVLTAGSSATFVLLASKSTCLYKGAVVGFHSPVLVHWTGRKKPFSLNQMRLYLADMGQHLNAWGYEGRTINYVLSVTFMTPNSSVTNPSIEEVIVLIGDRYIGFCKEEEK